MLLLIIIIALKLSAIFDDSFYDPYSLAYSNTLLDFPVRSNPATYGNIRNLTVSSSYSSLKYNQFGSFQNNIKRYDFYIPSILYSKNVTYNVSYERNEIEKNNFNSFCFGIGSYYLLNEDNDYLDMGMNLKRVSSSDNKIFGLPTTDLDLGILARRKDYIFALSFLNLKGGSSFYGFDRTTKFSFSRIMDETSLGFGFSVKNSDYSSYTFSLAFSQLFRTYRYGYFRIANSIFSGKNRSGVNFGVFYNKDLWEISYSFGFSLSSPHTFSNSIGLTIYFGRRDVESDYEKIIKREVKYRKDLMEELLNAAKREEKLKKEISSMQSQIDELSYQLKKLDEKINLEKKEKETLISEKEKIRENLESIIEQQKKNEQSLREIEKQREEQKRKMIEDEFRRDFEKYLKIKSSNASKDALIQYLRRIIVEYQDKNVDISPATIELQRLMKR